MQKGTSRKTKENKKDFQRGTVMRISRDMVVDDDINPRTITEDNMRRLKASIEKNGLVGHLVWNRTTGHIVGGHQRLCALDSLMHTKKYDLDVLMVEMPLKDEVRLNVALNQRDAQGEFDFFKISELAESFSLDLSEDFGFSDEMIEINFPEFSVTPDETEQAGEPKRTASEEDISKIKERKQELRERNKEWAEEYGKPGAEPKGVLTIVFDRESAKRQWFLDRGIDDPPNVMHVYDFEKLFAK